MDHSTTRDKEELHCIISALIRVGKGTIAGAGNYIYTRYILKTLQGRNALTIVDEVSCGLCRHHLNVLFCWTIRAKHQSVDMSS